MAKFRQIRNSLIAGEIAPTAFGRTDLPQYPHACKTLRNMIPLLSGGAYRRPGTIYQDKYEFVDFAAPMEFPFTASDGREFTVVILPQRSGGSGSAIEIYSSQDVALSDVFGVSTKYTPLIHTSPFEWTREDLERCKFLQVGDELRLVTPGKKPFRIVMTGPAPIFEAYDFDYGILGATLRDMWPYKKQNTTSTTFTASGLTGVITVSMSDIVFTGTGHIGSLMKVNSGGAYGCVRILTEPTNTVPQTFSAVTIVDLGSVGAVTTWWESAWSNNKGWPGAIELFNQRVGYAGNDHLPDSVWWTENGDFNQLSKDSILDPDALSSVQLTEPFTMTLAAGARSRIVWMKAARGLLVGTHQSEWQVEKNDAGILFSGANWSASRQSEYGSSGVIAYTGNELFFVSKDGSLIRSFAYSYYDQSYVADEVHVLYTEFPSAPPLDTYLSSQCARAIIQMVWDESRQTLWCIDNAGALRGLTRSKKANVSLWHSHELGGFDASVTPDLAEVDPEHPISQLVCSGAIVGICAIADELTKKENLWLIVRRYIDGEWLWVIETMRGGVIYSESAYSQIVASQSVFTDCSRVVKATAAVSTYALEYLEGESVRGTASALDHGIFTVKEGVVAAGVVSDTEMDWQSLPNYPGPLDGEYWIAFGFNFKSIVEPVRIEAGSVVGTAQDAMKRIHKAFVRFYKTISAKVGPDENRLEDLQFRDGDTPMDKSAEFFTGDKEILLNNDFDRDGYLRIEQAEPLPFSVVSIVSEGQTYDG